METDFIEAKTLDGGISIIKIGLATKETDKQVEEWFKELSI